MGVVVVKLRFWRRVVIACLGKKEEESMIGRSTMLGASELFNSEIVGLVW